MRTKARNLVTPIFEDFRNDDPEQFRVIGWVKGKLYSVIIEVREDAEDDSFIL